MPLVFVFFDTGAHVDQTCKTMAENSLESDNRGENTAISFISEEDLTMHSLHLAEVLGL